MTYRVCVTPTRRVLLCFLVFGVKTLSSRICGDGHASNDETHNGGLLLAVDVFVALVQQHCTYPPMGLRHAVRRRLHL